MKRKIMILYIIALIVIFCACNDHNIPNVSPSSVANTVPDNNQNNDNKEDQCIIYKSGGVCVLEATRLEANECEFGCYKIPLIPMLKELGAEVIWKSESIAKINWNEINYILDTENQSMYDENKPNESLFVIYAFDGGIKEPCLHKGGEKEDFWVDDSIFERIVNISSNNLNCKIDKDKNKAFCIPRVDKTYKLCINGINFENISTKIEESDISDIYSISLNEVLQSCGFVIERTGDIEAVASKNGSEYLINYSKHTFVEKGTENNLLENTDNRENYRCSYIFKNGEAKLFVDFETLNELMTKIDAPIYMVKNYFTSPYPIYIWSDYGK